MKRLKKFSSKNSSILNSSVTTYGKHKLRIVTNDVNWFNVQNYKKGLFSDSDDDDSKSLITYSKRLEQENQLHKEKTFNQKKNNGIFSDSDDSDIIVQSSQLHSTSTFKKKTNRKTQKKQSKRTEKKKKFDKNGNKKNIGKKLPGKVKKSSNDETTASKKSTPNNNSLDLASFKVDRVEPPCLDVRSSKNRRTKLKEKSEIVMKRCVVDLSNDKIPSKQETSSKNSFEGFDGVVKSCSVDLSRDKILKLSTDNSDCTPNFKLSSVHCKNVKMIDVAQAVEIQSKHSRDCESPQLSRKPLFDNKSSIDFYSSKSLFTSHLPLPAALLSSRKRHVTLRRKRVNFKITDGTSVFSFSNNFQESDESLDIFQNSILHGNHDSFFNIGSMLLQSFSQNKTLNSDKILIQSTPMTKNTKTRFPAALSPLLTVKSSPLNLCSSTISSIPSISLHLSPSSKLLSFHATPKRKSLLNSHGEDFLSPNITDKENVSLLCVEKILSECKQAVLSSFESLNYDESSCIKLGEGVYGEVYKCSSVNHPELAVKIVPVNGVEKVNNEKQKTFSEILPEIVNSRELTTLADRSSNCSDAFIRLYNVRCVSGKYPDFLLKAWDGFKRDHGSENQRPDFLRSTQNYIVFEYGKGGASVENFRFRNAAQALSVLRQAVAGLAVAEEVYSFEHRDLHWGNILVEPTRDKHVDFTLTGLTKQIESIGVIVKIIDFTFSRMTKGGLTLFQDLSTDPDLFLGDSSVDYQFQIYRMMHDENNNDWSLYRPRTNVFWIHYLTHKFLNTIKYKSTRTKIHVNSLKKLKLFNEGLLSYQSCSDLVRNSSLFSR